MNGNEDAVNGWDNVEVHVEETAALFILTCSSCPSMSCGKLHRAQFIWAVDMATGLASRPLPAVSEIPIQLLKFISLRNYSV
jgi:hypothetical protein